VLTVATDEESPDLRMAEQILGGGSKRRRRQCAPLERTPRREFRSPILEAPEQLGGKGPMPEVLSIVYDKLRIA